MTKDIPASGLYWTELRIFLEVAKSKSFNKAAQELGISHPTVARAVRRLETEMNTELLLAAGAPGVVLTPAGSRLARALESVDAEIEKIMRRVAVA
jgi:DNA-binding transcriptional LysR family regulator